MGNAVLRLEPSVSVEICAPWQPLEGPRYSVEGLAVDAGPPMDSTEHAKFVSEETFGSAEGYYAFERVDEYRFGRADGVLVALGLNIPEHLEEDQDRVSRWLSVDSVRGTLRLVEPKGPFSVTPAVTRWCSDRQMVLLRARRAATGANRARIEVTPGLQLLFEDGLLEGWIIEDPEYHIWPSSGSPSPYPPDPELAQILRDLLQLVAFPGLEGLWDADPGFRESLEGLASRIDVGSGAADRRETVHAYVLDLVQEWYEN